MRGLIVASVVLLGSVIYFISSEVNRSEINRNDRVDKLLQTYDTEDREIPVASVPLVRKQASNDGSSDVLPVESGNPEITVESVENLEECCDEELAMFADLMDMHNEGTTGASLSYRESFLLKHGDTPEAREYLDLSGRFKKQEPVPFEDFVRWSELNAHFFPWTENIDEHEALLKYIAEHGDKFKDATATYDMSVLDE